MTSVPRICVITPSLNQGQFIERTIRSVLDQGRSLTEYIVRDGGSTDATSAVLAHYADRLAAVVEPDRGQAAAVNKGIASTSGDVIGWLNSDDVYAPGALQVVAAYFTAHPEIDVLYGDADLVGVDDEHLGSYYTEPWRPERLPVRNILCQPAVFFRRRVVERFGRLDERLHYCMDYEYWLRLAQGRARFAYVPYVLAASRSHAETKTMRDRRAVHAELNRMLKQRLGYVPDSWLINHAYTLTELSRTGGQWRPIPFFVQMVCTALALSVAWNRTVEPSLVADLARRGLTAAALTCG